MRNKFSLDNYISSWNGWLCRRMSPYVAVWRRMSPIASKVAVASQKLKVLDNLHLLMSQKQYFAEGRQ